jgi:hypothetical protein
LEGRHISTRHKPIEVLGERLARKCRWVGKTTGERDQVGLVGEVQDCRQAIGGACLSPLRE